jgi:hypothetical protein
MKTKAILIMSITLFLLAGMGCEEVPADYYKGKIIALNNHIAYSDVIEIQQPVEYGISIGQTISVGVQLTDKGFELNEVVCFKIIRSQKWVGPETADHIWPDYTGVIELYTN